MKDGGFIVGVIGLAIGAVGTYRTIRADRSVKRFQAELLRGKNTYTWEEIDLLVSKAAEHVREVSPQFIVTSAGAPALIAALIVEKLFLFTPMVVVLYKSKRIPDIASPSNARDEWLASEYVMLSPATYGYKIYVPKLTSYPKGKVVFVTDVSSDLQTMLIFSNYYNQKGYPLSDIHWVSLFAHKTFVQRVADRAYREVELPHVYHAREFKSDRLALPWAIDEAAED